MRISVNVGWVNSDTLSFGAEKLQDNLHTVSVVIKGQYLRSISVSATMGHGIKVNPKPNESRSVISWIKRVNMDIVLY